MSLRFRILFSFTAVVVLGFAVLAYWVRGEFRDSYSYVVEELLVDVSHLMAAVIEENSGQEIDLESVDHIFNRYKQRNYNANIFKFKKDKPTLDMYITDNNGYVIYSSRDESELGQDYSQWNDVFLTLKGEYGARSTRLEKDEASSSVYFIGSPLTLEEEPKGMLSIIKTEESILLYLNRWIKNMALSAVVGLILVVVFGVMLFFWLTKPLDTLRNFVLKVAAGESVRIPNFKVKEVKQLGDAFEEMRISLEGKKTIEQFTQALTHEMKSPLTAIKGAAELCIEDMPAQQRIKFLNNIVSEADRAKQILDELLYIARLEAAKSLENVDPINLHELTENVKKGLMGMWKPQNIEVEIVAEGNTKMHGDPFLIEQALRNLLHNSIEFSPEGSTIRVLIKGKGKTIDIDIVDEGSGIPSFAQGRIFEKFYSLERPISKKKSSGLGLSFVKEVAELHKGSVSIKSPVSESGRGTAAHIEFPCEVS